jgi:type I restriction enzyme, S subunit
MMEGLGFRPYEAYKDSRVDWIGSIPSTWDVRRAKWLFKRMDRGVRPEDDIVTCFRDGEVTLRSNRRTEGFTTALKEIGYQGIRKGDLVIHAMDAFAGAIGVSDSDGKATPVYSACVPRQPDTVDPTFYAYYMRHLALSGFLVSLAKGIRERSTDFRFNDFAELEVPFPSLAEQRAIVAFLDEKCAKADGAVKIKEDQIALLRERRQIIIQDAVTRGLNPAAPMKDSGIDWIGQIPAHWDVVRFKYLFTQSRLPVQDDDEIVTSYRDGQVTLRSNRRLDGYTEAIIEGGYQGIRPGQLVLNSMDAFEGAIGVSDSAGKCTPEYVICDPNNSKINQYYFSYLLREMALAKYIQVICNAVRQRAVRIRFNNLATRFLVVPPLEEQKEIVDFIDAQKVKITEAIAIKELQIAALKEYKTSLINAAVTGKIKVI